MTIHNMAPPVAPPISSDGDGNVNSIQDKLAVNGPGNDPCSTDSKAWERPWTIEEIKKEAGNWSLAGDAGLLLYLQKFSHNIISKTHAIEMQVNNLVYETKITGVRVNNVFNEFFMLANTQFVENRVYDEDVNTEDLTHGEKKPEKVEKTREEREAELIPKITEALKFGINVIEQSFEKLDTNAGNSDSEEEEGGYRVDPILEAKDPYLQRPLPYLIGSSNFMQDDNVGLLEIFSEEEEESDQGSISHSESEPEKGKLDESESEYSETESDEDVSRQRQATSIKSQQDSGSDGDDLFDRKDSASEEEQQLDDEEKGNTPEKSPSIGGFQAELAAKIGSPSIVPVNTGEKARKESIPSRTSSTMSKHSHVSGEKTKKRSKTRETITEPDPFVVVDEDDNSPFGQSGVFSSSKGLFDDDDESGNQFEEDLHKPASNQKINETEEESHRGRSNLFSKSEETKVLKKEKPTFQGATKGWFDEEDDDGDLFSSVQLPKSITKEFGGQQQKATVDLFGSDDEDDQDDLFAKQPSKVEQAKISKSVPGGKKILPGAVSIFGNASDALTAAMRKQHLLSDDEDEKQQLYDEKSVEGSMKSAQSGTSLSSTFKSWDATHSSSHSNNSLFMDEPDNNLFSAAKPANASSKPKTGFSLFSDEDEEDAGGDLFGASTKVETKKENPEKQSPASGLFDDEGSNLSEPSSKPAESAKKKPVGGIPIFGGIDVIGQKKGPTEEKRDEEKKQESPPKTTVKKTMLSLFDDDDNDERSSEIFQSAAVASPLQQPKTRNKSRSLFEDEEILFGTLEESPSVDLFSSHGPVSKKVSGEPVAAVNTQQQHPLPPSYLFTEEDNEDEGDLFASKKITIANSGQAKVMGGTLKIHGATDTESSDATAQESKGKVKKPVGGVSIYGGTDPFAELQRQKSKSPEDLPKQSDQIFGVDDAGSIGEPVLGKQRDLGMNRKEELQEVQKTLEVGSVPGPLFESAQSAAASFDQPPTVTTLHSANKDRARILTKRRPPSRKGRRHPADQNSIQNPDTLSASPILSSQSSLLEVISPFEELGDGVDYTDGKSEVFNASLFGGMDEKTTSRSLEQQVKHEDAEGLFPPNKSTAADDLFGSNSVTQKIFSSENQKDKSFKKAKTKEILDDDDIFADASVNKRKDKKAKTVDIESVFASSSSNKKAARADVEAGSLDTPAKSQTRKLKKTFTKDEDLFKDDTDIFSNLPAVKPKERKKKSASKPAAKPIFKEDIDDIFADTSVSREKNSTKKKVSAGKPSSKPMFEDANTTIFEDPLSALITL